MSNLSGLFGMSVTYQLYFPVQIKINTSIKYSLDVQWILNNIYWFVKIGRTLAFSSKGPPFKSWWVRKFPLWISLVLNRTYLNILTWWKSPGMQCCSPNTFNYTSYSLTPYTGVCGFFFSLICYLPTHFACRGINTSFLGIIKFHYSIANPYMKLIFTLKPFIAFISVKKCCFTVSLFTTLVTLI